MTFQPGDVVAWVYDGAEGPERQHGFVHAVAQRDTATLPAGTVYVRTAGCRTALPKAPDDLILLWPAAAFSAACGRRLVELAGRISTTGQ